MTYLQLTYLHLATIAPAFLIGTFLLLRRKGTPLHKSLGRVYLVLMMATGFTTLFMPAQVGPKWLSHFGFIHLFSLLSLYSVPAAYVAARKGNIKVHRGHMLGLYVGGILIAGLFAFSPGRMLHQWLWCAGCVVTV
jgi:uncharacterized membrane protein